MDSGLIIQIVGSLVSLLCCCAFWGVVIFAVYKMFIAKGDDDAVSAAIDTASDTASDAASAANANKEAEPAAAPADEDEVNTVVAEPPSAPPPSAPDAPARPQPRTSGATIIAFDDDFEDDDE